MFTPEQIATLTEAGLIQKQSQAEPETVVNQPINQSQTQFTPSGLNDENRVDLSQQPFLAIDSHGTPHEIDDGIRAYCTTSGYQIEVAIPDMGQLSERPDLVEEAIRHGHSRYHDNYYGDLQYPSKVISALELAGGGLCRALVISMGFDSDCTPVRAEIVPAQVRVHQLTMRKLGHLFARRDPAVSRLRATVDGFGLETNLPTDTKPEAMRIQWETGRKTVELCMLWCNVIATQLADSYNIPVLHRASTTSQDGKTVAFFTTERVTHSSIKHRGQVVYTPVTSPLHEPAQTLNVVNFAHVLAGKPAPYTNDHLDELAGQLNRNQSLKDRKIS